MLKRIAVIGGENDSSSRLKSMCSEDIQLVPIDSSDSLPDNIDALISDSASKEQLNTAIDMAERSLNTFALLAEAIDCRESFKPDSSRRVVEHATRFAKALGLNQYDQIKLERGAQLRDIGKLKISNSVLLNDSLLTFDDWTLIQQHTTIGAELVKTIDGLQGIADIVHRHHESWDGDGYPDKLEKEDIPYLARVVRILDVYCAMTSPRPYREGVASKEQALEHLQSERGKHFDPELIDVFLDNDLGGESINS